MKDKRQAAVEGKVLSDLPSGMYKVELDHGGEVIAHVAAEMRMKFTRIRPGDKVSVELSTYNHARGRIVAHDK